MKYLHQVYEMSITALIFVLLKQILEDEYLY